MAIFVRIATIPVWVLDALTYSMAGDTAVGEPQIFSWDLESWLLTASYVLAAVVAGLLASEVL